MARTHLECPFFDADDFHPPENVAKMSAGIPLDDPDRQPRLAAMAAAIKKCLAAVQYSPLACSALKNAYRRFLRASPEVRFIYLEGSGPACSPGGGIV
ncbi:MAG: hypothetical protein R3335_10405 [Anaerolineales bacterium]|nr:hypothetical protein [Anaerolineales bacterium]